MKVKSMTATFGKLDHARLELAEGLNLIHAPNEGGKSTWAAFWKTMLFGLDTRDRDKKGYLADKNRYQPWSGAPMAGELVVEWQGRDITIRRGPKGATPFGSFSAVYTNTGEPVPGLTADNCGRVLTGVGREVFERSAFLGNSLAITAAPELEARIAALVSSGQEDVSYSKTEAQLKDWLNRRKVNRSVGLIPKLEGELQQILDRQSAMEAVAADIARLETARIELEQQKSDLIFEQAIHRRLAQRELNQRCAQAGQDLEIARAQLMSLEQEAAKYGPLPAPELLRSAQGELQYLNVLDEEIRQGEEALAQAEEAYVQAQIDAQDEHFQGLSWEEARGQIAVEVKAYDEKTARRKKLQGRGFLLCGLGGLCLLAGLGGTALANTSGLAAQWYAAGFSSSWLLFAGVAVGVFCWLLSILSLLQSSRCGAQATQILSRYHTDTPERLTALAEDYAARCDAAEEAANHAKAVRGTLNDRKARRANTHTDLLSFVHSFAPQVTDRFGCSAALSRALSLGHELTLARARLEERRLRREDLLAQGGQDFDTLELLHTPDHSPEETDRLLSAADTRLDQVNEQLNQCRGRQGAMGDPAALAARREELEGELARRRQEYDAISMAMDALKQANGRLQERFSPELNRLAGDYLARLTGQRYVSLSLNREMEGCAARAEDVLPHSALYLSRGTADQLYLAVRLAVCQLCLPDRPPILLDDALAAFDDERLGLALELLLELAREQQVLLFSCQSRESALLKDVPHLTRHTL